MKGKRKNCKYAIIVNTRDGLKFVAMVVEVPDYIQDLGNKSIPAYEPDIETE